MRVVHEGAEERRVLANDVAVADSVLARGRGLMFRRSVPDDYALVFPFGRARTRRLHMLFVPFAVDAVWTVDGTVTAVERLPAWTGHGGARADVVYELPAGAAAAVAVDDRVYRTGENGTPK